MPGVNIANHRKMKFGENLQAHVAPEWRSQYVDYEYLKTLLYESQEQSPDPDIIEQAVLQRYNAKFEERFFAICEKELLKVNTFYAEKLAECTRKFVTLQTELQTEKRRRKISIFHSWQERTFFSSSSKKKTRIKTVQDLKLAFSEFYLSLILLQNYQDLNFTAFRKILKKFDKMYAIDRGGKWLSKHVVTSAFRTDTQNSQLIVKTETLYINDLENGNRSKAMKRLRVPPLAEFENDMRWRAFRVGLFSGVFFASLLAGILSAVYLNIQVDPWLVVDLYRPGLVLYLFLFFIAINTWGWRTAGVNHILIFEIDPRQHISHYHLFELASLSALLWTISGILLMFGNLETTPENIPVYLSPGLLYGTYFAFLLNPLPCLYHKARFWLLKRLWRLFACGFYHVEFADFWLADQLNSLVSLFLDCEFVICYYGIDGSIWRGWVKEDRNLRICGSYSYGIRAILACYPAWIRFVQCLRRFSDTKKRFPHLVNAGKYSTVFFKVTFHALFVLYYEQTQQLSNAYFYLWLVSEIISTCYSLAWDIKMDWGFLDENAGENKWLREEIVYSSKSYYYFAIVEDVVLRFAWIAKITISHTVDVPQSVLRTVFVVLEVFRRFVWNFIRLENEHLNNCGEFRAVRDISIAPLHEDDYTTLQRMMDEEDGVEQYRLRIRNPGKDGNSALLKRKGPPVQHKSSSEVVLYLGSGKSKRGDRIASGV